MKFSKRITKTGILIISILIVIVLLISFAFINKKEESTKNESHSNHSSQNEPESDDKTVTMLATGDWIAHDAINAAAKTGSEYNYSSMVTAFRPFFDKADINFCNLATLAGGVGHGISGYPVFNAPVEWNRDMHNLGCNLINAGTNHTNDKGQGPITSELDDWDKKDILAIAGANRSDEEQNKVRYFEVKGIKFAFLSYSTYSNSPNPNSYSLNRFQEPLVTNQMTEARSNADIVIVSMRWGTEYSPDINSAQERDAQKLSELGADIVLGHGQHVLGPVKRLSGQEDRQTIVWYGLGNFLNAQLEIETLTGCVAQFEFDTTTKKVSGTSCLPFYQHYDWTAEDRAAERLMNRSNFSIMPLFDANESIAKSGLGTTVEEQTRRIDNLVNSFTEVPVINKL